MKRKLRHPIRSVTEPYGKAGLLVAILALVLATTGAAFAAAGLSSKQKKQVTAIAKKYAGKNGANGATGPTGPAGKNGVNGVNGANGAKGDTGATGPEGPQGNEGPTGPEGPPGAIHPGETLPSGATETGAWAFVNQHARSLEQIFEPISFPIRLASPVPQSNAKFLPPGAEPTEECPGSVEEPSAEPGFLCVYASFEINVAQDFFFKPTIATGAGTMGSIIHFKANETAEPEQTIDALGSWAVTAP